MKTMICERCGLEIPYTVNKQFCSACKIKARKEYRANYRVTKLNVGRKSQRKGHTIAICPMCGKQHKTTIKWTGNGTPRIYCEKCKTVDAVQQVPSTIYTFSYHRG